MAATIINVPGNPIVRLRMFDIFEIISVYKYTAGIFAVLSSRDDAVLARIILVDQGHIGKTTLFTAKVLDHLSVVMRAVTLSYREVSIFAFHVHSAVSNLLGHHP